MNYIFIQARYNSSRLKGKVLKKINNKTILQFLVDRLKKIKKSKIIILTSLNKSDDIIENHCKQNSINYFRGSHLNVYKRYCDAIKYYKPKFFVRICADSPLQNIGIINKMINIYKKKKYKIVSNAFPRTFPKGMTVEVVQSKFFIKKKNFINKKIYKEHIISYFYENEKKNIYNFQHSKNFGNINLSINNFSDFKRIKKIIEMNSNKLNNLNFLIKAFKN